MPFIDCETSYIPNTTMKIVTGVTGIQFGYYFTPDDGYVLHVKGEDEQIYDENYENIIGYRERYCAGGTSVNINYDFSVVVPDTYTYTDENGMTVNIPIERIGAEELYTLPESVVPSNQIYGGSNDHEVMSDNDQTEKE